MTYPPTILQNIYIYVLFYKVNTTIRTKESLTWVVEVEAIVTSWLSAMGGEGGRSSAVGKAAAVAVVLCQCWTVHRPEVSASSAPQSTTTKA